jgi:hypothetical protein
MTKAQHEAEVKRVTDLMQEAIDREFQRATTEGYSQVRAWAVDANYNVLNHGNPRGAAAAAFQQAAYQFRPKPLTFKEVMQDGVPTNVKEAVDAVTGS